MGDRIAAGKLRPDLFGDSIVPLTGIITRNVIRVATVPLTAIVFGEKKVVGHVTVKGDGTVEAVIEDKAFAGLVLRGDIKGISLSPSSEPMVVLS